jgi:RHS repeat-associated protein
MHGRLAQIDDNGKLVTYKYNSKNQLTEQVINGIPVYYTYTQFGQLEGKYMGSKESPIAFLKYTYDNDGMITARNVNGANQLYAYDLKGQLTSVTQDGKVVESYTYDPAGNILKKVVAGKTTEFTYDAANQLVSMTENSGEAGKNAVRRTDFAYDAARRMTQQIHGEAGTDALRRTEYAYGWMNKVMSISENGKVSATYDYHVDGQVAKRLGADGKAQDFFWDGLALIRRGETNLTNEPYVTGGNPIIANGTTLFNDILGTTQGATDGKDFAAISRDSFGQTLDNSTDTDYDYFTGKPKVEGLGYAFLFRNYAAGLGKWTTSDPLGYPDGWNNFAYVNNRVTGCIDWRGGNIYQVQDAQGAAGAGHTAWIAQRQNGKFYAIDYNPNGNIGTRTAQFNSLNEALAYLNQDNNRYESYLEFSTTLQHGENFIADMLPKITDDAYTLDGDNNCYTSGANSFNSTNPDPYGDELDTATCPNTAYNRNSKLPGTTKHVYE